jgi:hypothetical protein
MSAESNTTTETTTERYAREVAHRATPEGAREALERDHSLRDERIAANLRESWGPYESDFDRGLAANDLAIQRLGMTPEELDGLERWVGRQGALEMGRRIGEGLALLDPEMTAAEARVRVRELQRTPGFLRTLETDERARKEWDGLTSLAARPR